MDRKSDRELVVTRLFSAPARRVFEVWTQPEQFRRWWAPKSFGISFLSCEIDARTGGTYRHVLSHPASKQPMAFFGRYLEATPARLVWTNDEVGDGGAVTTVTFEDRGGETLLAWHDVYPSKEALDEAVASQSTSGFSESFEQLDELLVRSA